MTRDILVTGSRGFIGRHLVERLKGLPDFNVFEYDMDDGDISKDPLVFKGINHVFHLAARTFIPESWERPFDFYDVNIKGTLNALELCRRQGAGLTYISAYVYGQPENLPITEGHALKPNSPYMHSKVMAESLCEFYSKNYGVRISVLRPFNVYGPGQKEPFLIPRIINQVLDKERDRIEVTDIYPKRDYLYISDLIEALTLTINTDRSFSVYNVGSGYSMSVGEILNTIFNVSKIKKPIVSKDIRRKNEVMDVIADISKIKRELNWCPLTGFSDGIKKILQGLTSI